MSRGVQVSAAGVVGSYVRAGQLRAGWCLAIIAILRAPPMATQILDSDSIELLARAFHDHYRDRRRGLESADDPAMRDWVELAETLRESNRALARDVPRKLASIGASISRASDSAFVLTAAELEVLAADEHERWVHERLAAGWTLGARDPARKSTPYLVPYAQLPDEVKEYDRDAVRVIPDVLARIGAGVRRDA